MKELGLIALESADQMGTRIDQILSEWHNAEGEKMKKSGILNNSFRSPS